MSPIKNTGRLLAHSILAAVSFTLAPAYPASALARNRNSGLMNG
ncbi:hypothetical protein [Serratia sp. CY43514]